jgi:hypothetical protein
MSTQAKKREYWSEHNQLWESSTLYQQKFCEEQGLSYRQFIFWRGQLKAEKLGCSKPKLLKISTEAARPKSMVITEPTSSLEVILPSGIKLYIKSEADVNKAGALIQFLGGLR